MDKLHFIIFTSLFLMAKSSPLIQRNIPKSTHKSNPADYRLPENVLPLNYSISLVIDPNAEGYYGGTRIRIKILNDTDSIYLHANKLNITYYALKDQSGNDIPIANITRSTNDKHFLTLDFKNVLMTDQTYDLEFRHESHYGQLTGLYLNSYVNSNGTKRYLAISQLGLTSAREVFPCFDEPALKAVFDVEIHSPQEYNVISNMDTIQTSNSSIAGYLMTSFHSTPLMSTYLLAFMVSDFEYQSNTEVGQIIYPKEFRIYARPTAKESLYYALEMGQKNIQFLQTFMDVPYRMPKVDNVALPEISFGAMENWGMITYKEENLIYSKDDPSTQGMYRVNLLLAHEITHFWFGDEVTPVWWDYTWMKEGFATFFEQYASDNVVDGWRVMEHFVAFRMHNMMDDDSLATTNPMSNPVVTPNEIMANFNSIAYIKAACVIRMMHHILGESNFRLALSSYVKSLPTGITEPKILFDEMQKVVGPLAILPDNVTVNDVFGSWSEQAGYPIIYAERTLNTSRVRVRQERYYKDDSISSNETWWVPLTWTSDSKADFSNTTTEIWLKPTDSCLEITIDSANDWFIFNKQQTGYYRVMYDFENWKNLANALNNENHSLFHPLNKAQLMEDAASFSLGGHLEYEITFNLLNYLSKEIDWIPWITADRILNILDIFLPASEYFHLYEAFKVNLTSNAFDIATLEVGSNDTYVRKRLRPIVSNIACASGSIKCRNSAENALRNFVENGVTVHNDVKLAVYCGGLQSGNKELWNGLFREYQNENDTSEINVFIQSLGCSSNTDVIDEYLLEIVSDNSQVREEDVELAVIFVINERKVGLERSLLFFNNEFLQLRQRLISNPFGTTRLILTLGFLSVSDDNISLFQAFAEKFESSFSPDEKAAVEQAWNVINNNRFWIDKNMDSINRWLLENVMQ